MFLTIYIYAVIGINMFAGIKRREPMNENMNFETIGSAFIVLGKTFTNDAWVDVVDVLA